MKTKYLLALAFCASLAVSAQNLAVTTHAASNSEEFKSGCPGEWPCYIKDLKDSTVLPNDLDPDKWAVWTVEKFEATKSRLSAEKAAFDIIWKEKTGTGRSWTALEFTERLDKFAPGALDALDDAIANAGLPAEVRAQLRIARRRLLAAQEVNSKNDETVKFMAAAVALGILTQDQADHVLKDP